MTQRLSDLCRAVAILVAALFLTPIAHAQQRGALPGTPSAASPQITASVSDANLTRLAHQRRPEANAVNDRGPLADDTPLPHMLLQLQRAPEQEQALRQLIDQIHDPNSPNFHRWLTAQDFGARFGAAPQDLQTITTWLQRHGFQINFTYPNGTLIDFSGTAGEVREAFHTELHRLSVSGKSHFANMSDPQIPAALAPAVAGIVGLHDFMPQRQYKPRPAFTIGGGEFALAPADLATIYNINPLFASGISGQGQTIAVVEDTDVFSTADWTTFRSTFGLSGYTSGSFTQIHPAPAAGVNNCADPGTNGDDGEAILDAEWASAAAPSAQIVLVSCANPGGTGDGIIIAIQNLINGASPPPIISISYGECEAQNTDNASYNAAYQQAVAEGISVFVAAGDWGAAVCDASFDDGVEARQGIAVNGLASTPYNVAVGGTDFEDTYLNQQSNYWNATNTSTFGSAKSYVPEIPWNNTCASTLIAGFVSGNSTTYGAGGFCNNTVATNTYPFLLSIVAGSGGASTLYGKPSWQAGFTGIQNDGARDLPDVSLFSGNGVWGHYLIFCWSDVANGGTPCTGSPANWSGAGGTSFASPIMAGIQALVDQKNGGRQGNPNPVYYGLAAVEYGLSTTQCNSSAGNSVVPSCIFYDITQGDDDVPCVGSNDCFHGAPPSGSFGVLSTSDSSYQKAFGTTTGWDFATGIGSVNAFNLVWGWGPNLTLNVVGSGTVMTAPAGLTCTANCVGAFATGTFVVLSETPAPGWTFVGWSGGCTGNDNDCGVSLSTAKTVVATFTTDNFTLAMTVNGDGAVESHPAGIFCGQAVAPQVCGAQFAANQPVTLSEIPGDPFRGWGGACSGGAGTCVVTASGGTVNVSATFSPNITLTVSEVGNGVVTSVPAGIACGSTCTASFAPGATVSLTATPAPGWSFRGWSGACSGLSSCSGAINAPETVSAMFVLGTGGGGVNGNTWAYICNASSFDNLNGALAGTAAWSSTTSSMAAANGNKGQPAPGDIILIANTCLGNITITTDNLTLTNHNDSTMAPLESSSFPEGIEGQVEIVGAHDVTVRNIEASGTGAANGNIANLYVHDGATATVQNDLIGRGWMGNGIDIAANASLVILNSKVSIQSGPYGILAEDRGALTVGNADGSQPSQVTGPASVAGLGLTNHAIASLYGSSFTTSAPEQISATGSSSLHLSGDRISHAQNTAGPAVSVIGGSSVLIDTLGNGVATAIDGSSASALLLAGTSTGTLSGAILLATGAQPTIRASMASSLTLAGGNSISNTAGGNAIIVDHIAVALQQAGSVLGYANAPENIVGNGAVQIEGSLDLGQGPIGGAYGLTWNGSVAVQQNSSFRMEGGVHITGSVQLLQQSNGFANCNNSGGSCSSAGAANAVDGGIVCSQSVSSPANPSAHISNPPLVTSTVTVGNVFGAGSFATTNETANTCLNF